MARDLDESYLDDLLKMMDEPPQKQGKIVITPDEGPIDKFNMNESDLGEMVRKNYNSASGSAADAVADLKETQKVAEGGAVINEANLEELAKATRERPEFSYQKPEASFDAKSFYDRLNKQLDDVEKPEQQDTISMLIEHLGPALLAAGTGTYAAAKPTYEQMQKFSKERKDLSKADKTARLQGLGRQLQGAAELRKSDTEVQKQAFDENKYKYEQAGNKLDKAFEIEKYLAGASGEERKAARANTMQALKEYNELVGKGIDKSADVEGKSLDRVSEEKKLGAKEAKDDLRDKRNSARDSSALRKEFQARPIVKDFNEIEAGYNKVISGAKNPSAAGDLSMIFGFMKINDPGSVVREGEQATAQNAAGATDQLRNLYNRVLTGQRLTPKQRADFSNQSKNLVRARAKALKEVEGEFSGLSGQYGYDQGLIFKPKADSFLSAEEDLAMSVKDKKALEWANNPKAPGWTKEKAEAVLKAIGQ